MEEREQSPEPRGRAEVAARLAAAVLKAEASLLRDHERRRPRGAGGVSEAAGYLRRRLDMAEREILEPCNSCDHPGNQSPCAECPREAEAFSRGLVSIATPGEWYVWADEQEGTVQLMSRTHGTIVPRIPLSPQTRGDLMAAAAAVNLIREQRS